MGEEPAVGHHPGSTNDVAPVPMPTSNSQSNSNCQGSFIRDDASTASETINSEPGTARRSPIRFMRPAAKGPINPKNRIFTATAVEINARDQPNSASNRTIKRLGVERTPAPASSTTKVTPAITHA